MKGYEKAQAEYDARLPDEDDGRLDYIEENVNELLNGADARDVLFEDFAESAMDNIFTGPKADLVFNVLLAIGNGDPEGAAKLATPLMAIIADTAWNMVEGALE